MFFAFVFCLFLFCFCFCFLFVLVLFLLVSSEVSHVTLMMIIPPPHHLKKLPQHPGAAPVCLGLDLRKINRAPELALGVKMGVSGTNIGHSGTDY